MALPYVTPGQLALVENKINDLNEKLTDEDIESVKAVQSPKNATANQVLTADGNGKAVYKDVSTKTLWSTGFLLMAKDSKGKKLIDLIGGTTFYWDGRLSQSDGKPTFYFNYELEGIPFYGTGRLDAVTSDGVAKKGTIGYLSILTDQYNHLNAYMLIIPDDGGDREGVIVPIGNSGSDSDIPTFSQFWGTKKIQ